MQIASILSDLNSLRVCPPAAALALVSARPPPTTAQPSNSDTKVTEVKLEDRKEDQEDDVDMQRATDLVELHYGVKVRYSAPEGGKELVRARRDVDGVLERLGDVAGKG